MNKLIKRSLAFIIDLMICSIIIVGLSSIKTLNPLGTKIDEAYKDLSYEVSRYDDFNTYYNKISKDNIINDKEYKVITTEYDSYSKLFKDIKLNEELKDEKVAEIRDNIDIRYIEVTNSYGYQINRLTRYQTIITIIIYLLYFIILEIVLKGQTIGKKLMRIKVVDSKDIKKHVPIWKYIGRVILTTGVIFIAIDLILVMNLKEKAYLEAYYWLSNIKYVYQMLFLVCIIVRDDQRSIHDLIFNTRIARLDKDGNEVEDILFKYVEDTSKEVKEVKETKPKKKKKEVVEAIKVNDKKRINKDN